MKHFRVLLPLLVLALVLSGCAREPEPYTYTFNGKTIHIYPESGTIVDGLDVYRYTRTENEDRSISYVITYPNGGRYNWTESRHGSEGGGTGINEAMHIPGNILVHALKQGEPRGGAGSFGLGLLLIGLGAWHILAPESVIYLSKGWIFKNAEPSDFSLTLTRVGGGLFALAGLTACFV